jgi:hypothetical protein
MSFLTTNGAGFAFKFGDVTYSYDLAFLASVALAVLVVFLFSLKKFEEPTVEKNDDDFITQLLPKFLARPEEYSHAHMLYTTAMAGIVVVLSFLGPRVVGIGAENIPEAPSALPMFIALVIVGMLPNVPWLQQLEFQLRRFAHQRAFIPKAARAVSDKLSSAEFDFGLYRSDTVLKSPAMRGVERSDFIAPRDSIEYAWARVSCLLYRFRYVQDADVALSFDEEVLTRYAKDLEALVLKRRTMADAIAKYRKQKLQHPYHSDDALHATLRKTLRKIYLLLGCAVRLKIGTAAEMNPALKPFGFVLDSGVMRSEHKDLMIVGLGVMAAAVFALAYVASPVGGLVAHWVGSELSGSIPQGSEAFSWLLSALLTHGTAMLVAERMRSRRLAADKWFLTSGLVRRGTAANYILVALACAVISFVPLFLFGMVYTNASLELAKVVGPFLLLPAATGTFFVWHLDNVDLGRRPGRLREIAAQAVVTSLCAAIAVNMSVTEIGLDLLLLNAAVGAAIGASLAWYVPQAAADSKAPDVLVQATGTHVLPMQAEAASADRLQDSHQVVPMIQQRPDKPKSTFAQDRLAA